MIDTRALLIEVLDEHDDASKWDGSPFEKIKRVSNTKVGRVGQAFTVRLCGSLELECKQAPHQSAWDIRIEGVTFEVKTATEDVRSAFQFNHIRLHREYEAVLCIGIAPEAIYFDAWTKADVVTGGAGHLVTMDKGSSATWKLTKRKDELRPISDFEIRIMELVA